MKPDGGTSEEFGTRELLWTLVDAYDKIDVAHGNCLTSALHLHQFFVVVIVYIYIVVIILLKNFNI